MIEAQNPDSEFPLRVFDRFGNTMSAKEFAAPVTKSGVITCTGNLFDVELHIDDPGVGENPAYPNGFGFYDETIMQGTTLTYGEVRRDLLCQVFNDLSHLIAPAADNCDGARVVFKGACKAID